MITQVFPFLAPLRAAQRKLFFYTGMRFDGRTYAAALHDGRLRHLIFSASNKMYNTDTGLDMVYQENKVFNLKLAAKTLDGLLIRPGETFSFWKAVRRADKHTRYKDGLVVNNGRLQAAYGGGLCQISNLLFWLFLHSPLTIVERHGHRVKVFPLPPGSEPDGTDATVSEGWLDLKVKNDTDMTFQIGIDFEDAYITGRLLADTASPYAYHIEGNGLEYFRKDGAVYESITIYRNEISAATGETLRKGMLYRNLCRVGYELPSGTAIKDTEGNYGQA